MKKGLCVCPFFFEQLAENKRALPHQQKALDRHAEQLKLDAVADLENGGLYKKVALLLTFSLLSVSLFFCFENAVDTALQVGDPNSVRQTLGEFAVAYNWISENNTGNVWPMQPDQVSGFLEYL